MEIIKVGVGVIILDDSKVLLGHRIPKALDTGGIYEPDSWCLPGGKQEYNETIIDCIKRETKEETDLDIEDVEVFNAMDDFGSDRHFVTIQTIAHSYFGVPQVMEPTIIDEWKWFDLHDLPENLYSPSKKAIEAYLKKEGK